MTDDFANPNKNMIEPERVTPVIRYALNWARRGIQPPGLYDMTKRRAVLIIYAYDLLIGDMADPPPGAEASEGEGEGE